MGDWFGSAVLEGNKVVCGLGFSAGFWERGWVLRGCGMGFGFYWIRFGSVVRVRGMVGGFLQDV